MRLAGWIGLLLSTGTAHAVIVHGAVTGPLGRPIAGARVQLIALGGPAHSVADTISGVDGGYEIRSKASGRFLLLTSYGAYAPQLSTEFYAGRTDLLLRAIVLDPRAISPQDSAVGSGLRTPLAQLAEPPEQTAAVRLLPRATIAGALATGAGNYLLEHGQTGQETTLFVQGADPGLVGVLVDAVEVNALSGRAGRAVNLGAISTTGFGAPEPAPAVEVLSGPDPLSPLTAAGGVVALVTPQATNSHLALDYAGDGGNLHSWQDQAEVTATRRRADVLVAGSRFDTSNALPNDRFHLGTLAANAGYNVSANTSLRVTARQGAAVGALPIPYDLGLSPLTRDAEQDTYGTAVFSTRTVRDWHNEVRYGMLRSREQTFAYSNPRGRVVTLTGANGYMATGQAAPFPLPARQDQATARDDCRYRTDYPLRRQITGLLELRYQDERGLDAAGGGRLTVERRNLGGVGTVQAELKQRLFLQASGEVTHSSRFGLLGTPRVGLTFVPVVPNGNRRFHGTALHANVSEGLSEPSLPAQGLGVNVVARTRRVEVSVDQNLYREKLVLHGSYFHNQFAHQVEELGETSRFAGDPLVGAGLAYRTQGATLDVHYQPRPRILVRGTYTYLASLVEQTAATASFNPAIPGIGIGALTALAGARPFNRPAESGSVTAGYSGRLVSGWLEGSFAGRSDDTTGTAQTPELLLPNRNLNHGFARMDANLAFQVSRRTSVFAQAQNLLNDQHIGTIGYPSTPFTVRAGLRFRLGGD